MVQIQHIWRFSPCSVKSKHRKTLWILFTVVKQLTAQKSQTQMKERVKKIYILCRRKIFINSAANKPQTEFNNDGVADAWL